MWRTWSISAFDLTLTVGFSGRVVGILLLIPLALCGCQAFRGLDVWNSSLLGFDA
jgi:hypothetical protein